MKKYGQVISKLRKSKGMTQQELGNALNVSYQAVSKWENNQTEPDLNTIEKLTEVFGISMSEFFDMAKNPEASLAATSNNQTSLQSHFLQFKLWYLIGGLGVIIFVLALCAIFIPVKLSSKAIFKKVDPAVFCITAEGPNTKQAGSGFFINSKGLAVTNYHVVVNCTSGKVQLNNGKTYNIKKVVGCDEDLDIAIIQIDIKKNKYVRFSNSNKISVGDVVYAIGYPESFVLGSVDSTFTQGIISKSSYVYEGNTYIQTTADMTHGNSGGVLLNQRGKAIGITTGMLSDGTVNYMNMAIPINKVKTVKRNLNVSLDEYYHMHRVFYFYSDGWVVSSKDFVSGDKISPITEPEKRGYTFAGWYTDQTYSTKFDFSKPLTNEIGCYAKWDANSYTISFDANGGSGNMEDVLATYNQEITLPLNSFERDHYDFAGWNLRGSTKIYTDGETVKNLSYEDGAIVVLDAIWEKEKYTIHFDGNGADGTMADLKLEYDQLANLPENAFEKTGYVFVGWLFDEVIYEDGQEVSGLCEDTSTITFVAQWEPIKYKVRFEYSDQQAYEQEFVYDQKDVLIENRFTITGYHFDHWQAENGGTYSDCQEVLNLSSISKTVIFTARFEVNKYYVKYNPVMPGLEPTIEEKNYGFNFHLLNNQYTYEGYLFDGWADADGNLMKEYYYSNLTTEHLATVEIFATWRICEYTLSYFRQSSDLLLAEDHEYFDVVTIKDDFNLEKEGYNFDAWRYYSSQTKEYYYFKPGQEVEKIPKPYYSDKVNFFPEWKPITYTVTFDSNGAEEGALQDIDCEYDKKFALPKNTFKKSGYVFLYWELNGEVFADETEFENLTAIDKATVSLKAVWEKHLDGSGTAQDPYKIKSAEEFVKFCKLSSYFGYNENHYVELMTDIDFNGQKIDTVVSFGGNFYGKNHTIKNFVLENDIYTVALFGTNNGTIENLCLENVAVKNGTSVALLVAENEGQIKNCNVVGQISISVSAPNYVGGLVGRNRGTIYSSWSDVDIMVSTGNLQTSIGGFVGYNLGGVDNCYSRSVINVPSVEIVSAIGGFAGKSVLGGNIIYSYSISQIDAVVTKSSPQIFVGGFIGMGDNCFVSNCFVKTDMSVSVNFSSSLLSSCPISDFCGTGNIFLYNVSSQNVYCSDASSFDILVNSNSFEIVPSASQENDANFKNETWMKENLFNILGNWIYEGNYPQLNSSALSRIEINTYEDFMLLNNKSIVVDCVLNCDIDLKGSPFMILTNYATFDGNGHYINNLIIVDGVDLGGSGTNFGLFIKNKGTIKNLKLTSTSVNVEGKVAVVGGIVGNNEGTIINCCLYGEVSSFSTGENLTGGICGYNVGLIKNCYSNLTLVASSSYMVKSGGIVGGGAGVIENCFSLGSISSNNSFTSSSNCYAAGICGGCVVGTKISNCLSFADITVTSTATYTSAMSIGGGDLTNCYKYMQQKLNENGVITTPKDGKTKQTLISKAFLSNIGYEEFISEANLEVNLNAVWVFSEIDFPTLWFDA